MVNNVKTGYVNPLTMMKNSRQAKPLNLGMMKAEEKLGDITEEIRINKQRAATVPGEEKQMDGKANLVLPGRFDRYEKTGQENVGCYSVMNDGRIRQNLAQLAGKEKKVALIEREITRMHTGSGIENSEIDDFKKDRMMADYSRLQGGYLSDAVFGMLDLEGVRNVYDECIANGMTEEEALEKYDEKLMERFGHFQEALALALEFVPLDEDATGELISYSDVYDEDGRLKVPVKLTFEEYHRNLQSIFENMMNELKDRKDDFPNLYKIYFHEQ